MSVSPVLLSQFKNLTFGFIFVWRFFSKNQHNHSTKKRTTATTKATEIAKPTKKLTATETEIATALGKCRLNHLMPYI